MLFFFRLSMLLQSSPKHRDCVWYARLVPEPADESLFDSAPLTSPSSQSLKSCFSNKSISIVYAICAQHPTQVTSAFTQFFLPMSAVFCDQPSRTSVVKIVGDIILAPRS
jgi:hypothetical protein